MTKTTTLIIIVIITFQVCNGQIKIDSSANLKREIPTYEDGEPNLFFKLTQQKVKQLKLENLQNGFDSLQIRFWIDYSLTDLRNLLIIKCVNSQWKATFYTLKVEWNAYDLTETVVKKKSINLNPKNGWDTFLDKLFSLQIETLPNMNDIPGLIDGWTDGITYNMEFATDKQYRFYGYHLPEEFQVKYWQAKNMVDILKLIESEFKINSGLK